jgi:hypothetical protein
MDEKHLLYHLHNLLPQRLLNHGCVGAKSPRKTTKILLSDMLGY